MSLPRIRDLCELFERCLEQPVDERESTARALCAGDSALLEKLLALLRKDRILDSADIRTESGLLRLSHMALSERTLRGQQVGPFRVESCIGTGGMGSVYQVRRIDGQVEQNAALKILKPGAVNAALLGRFSTERRTLAALDHPGVCRFLDAGTLPDGQPFVLMELVDGEPLLEYCDRRSLGLQQRLRLFLKVLQTIAYAHSKLLVHRDIKSSNVLVTANGEPKLLDFGIAKWIGVDEDQLTQTHERFLTPRSSAPEQYLGEPVGVGCDIYALGQLLYELLCGLPPFDFSGASAGEIERMLLERPAPLPSQRCLALPLSAASSREFSSVTSLSRALKGDLETIVLKCLRKRPEERYVTVEQLQAEVEAVLANRPIRARQGERWYRMRKFLSRNRLATSLVSALVVTMTCSLIVVTWQAIGMSQERNRALVERDRAQYAVNLLQEAFTAADPIRVVGGEITAREILRSARAPMAEILDAAPDLFVSLATILAEVELDLMLNDAAAEILEQSLEAARRASMTEADQRPLLLLWARALTDSNQRDQAAEVLDRIRVIDGHENTDWLLARGRWLLLENQADEAANHLQRALDSMPSDASDQRALIQARAELGYALSMAGEHARSLALFSESLDLLRVRYPEDHPFVVLTRYRRIDALHRAGDTQIAWSEAIAIQSVMEHMYGRDSAVAGRIYALLGRLEMARGNHRQAVEQYSQARRIWQATLGPSHPNQLRVAINLAHAMGTLDTQSQEAEDLFIEALSMADDRLGTTSQTSLAIRSHLARIHANRGNPLEGLRSLLADGQLTWEAVQSHNHWLSIFKEHLEIFGCDHPDLTVSIGQACRLIQQQLEHSGVSTPAISRTVIDPSPR